MYGAATWPAHSGRIAENGAGKTRAPLMNSEQGILNEHSRDEASRSRVDDIEMGLQ